jgi:hypothetical protein
MNPATIKAIIMAVAIAAASYAGWHFRGLKADADIAALKQEHAVVIASLQSAMAKAKADAEQSARNQERSHAEQMAKVAEKHQEEISNAKAKLDRAVSDYRAGSIRLRDKFACNCSSGTGRSAEVSAATSQRDGEAGIRLLSQDVEFLLQFASEADQLADQLRQCQSVIASDRSQ